ncbi:response regulator transcription factor [Maribacter algarum]|uniref:Response regulator transcription factor n=1 Tax=Maribacter algarum (ex Zhang et al. 2020) TaxID=2578118 RepID=A0A5S3QKT9_9FLAO|nr:response regulator transcription factor [Maribacter algarum]TMM58464.1 response regulator transcription factor [Maribacter algarum]
MKKTVITFGLLILALLLLFQISKYTLISGNRNIEIIIAVVAIVFFIIGIYLNKRSLHKKELPQNAIDHKKIASLDISKREYQVLKEISLGLSNKEIGDKLFLSESTIKTHVSNILVKLDAKRRTQAVQIAKKLRII